MAQQELLLFRPLPCTGELIVFFDYLRLVLLMEGLGAPASLAGGVLGGELPRLEVAQALSHPVLVLCLSNFELELAIEVAFTSHFGRRLLDRGL